MPRFKLELNVVGEDRIYLNYWDTAHGLDVTAQIKGDKLMQFVHSETDAQEADDPMEQVEISL